MEKFDYKGKQILIIGGAGLIGSHLSDQLLAQNARVIVIDNLCSGRIDNLDLENPNLKFENLDIGEYLHCHPDSQLDQFIAQSDFVYHLASPIGVGRAHLKGYQTTLRILQDGLNVVESCLRHKKPILYTSSSEIYGTGGEEKLTEEDTAGFGLQPRWGYGAAKMAIEHLVAGLNRDHGIPSWIVRFFNVVGPRQNPNTGLVVSAFCRAAIKDEDIVVHGDGSDRRTFLHVFDAVSAIAQIPHSAALQGRAINVGGTENTSIRELALLVKEICGRGNIVYRDYANVYGGSFVNVPDRRPCLQLIMDETNWSPQHSLREAIRGCFDSIEKQKDLIA